MASEVLLNTLENLTSGELKTFKWHLKTGVEEFHSIPVGKLESASSRTDVVDVVVANYNHEGAIKITLLILKKMQLNNLADKLQRANGGSALNPGSVLNPGSALNPGPAPQPSGRDFFKKCKTKLETGITSLTLILGELEDKQILNEEERAEIESHSLQSKKNQVLLTKISKKGDRAQEEFYQVLKICDPFLVEHLLQTS